MRVAVLGLGRMGHAVAERLSGRHDLVLWNRTREKASDLLGGRTTMAREPADAVGDADLVVTSMSDDGALEGLLSGDGHVESNLPDDAILVDTSTISPSLSARIEARIPRYVALPILGGPRAVRSGQATYLAGGRDVLQEGIAPLLQDLGGEVKRYERPSLACAGKVTVNLLLLSGIVTLAEAVTVGRAGGLDDDQLRDLLRGSPMLAPGLQNRFEGVFEGHGETWWPPPLAAKDASLAVGLAEANGTRLRLGPVIEAAYDSAVEMGLGGEDMVAVAQIYR
jgi:3-hydroxyisobutyrate dehydrogenase-like beta-hydroxyacid dehydrogenase